MSMKKQPDNTPQGALAKLWRSIVADTNTDSRLNYLISMYVERTANGSKVLKRKTKSTLHADITSTTMTWRKFTHLVFHLLRAVKLDVSVKLTFANGKSSVSTISIKSINTISDEGVKDKCTPIKKS